jgi:hypothetical protein
MTIAIAGNFTEGVVFAVDSACTYQQSDGDIRTIYNAAQKIFHVGLSPDWSDSPYGAVLFGDASYCGISWRNVIGNFWRQQAQKQIPANEMAQSFLAYLQAIEPDPEKRTESGVFFAGYGKDDLNVRCFKILAKNLSAQEIPIGGFQYDGVPNVVQMLLFGMTGQTRLEVNKRFGAVTIRKEGPDGTPIEKSLAQEVLDLIEATGVFCRPEMDMPLRDAIDYMHFLVYSTEKYFKFSSGAPICGGPVEIAAITIDRGFRRILTKPLDYSIHM